MNVYCFLSIKSSNEWLQQLIGQICKITLLHAKTSAQLLLGDLAYCKKSGRSLRVPSLLQKLEVKRLVKHFKLNQIRPWCTGKPHSYSIAKNKFWQEYIEGPVAAAIP